jgi:TATA-box binding protein (TBP) (component of TFIID and TFIIIB)
MAFADIPVSTQTFTVRSNIQHIELHRFYEELQPKDPESKNPLSDDGRRAAAILSINYKDNKKGSDPEKDKKVKKKRTIKEQKKPKRNFLNCITLIIQIEKRINIKIFKNGVFQLTGCKNVDNVRRCLILILQELSKTDCFKFTEGATNFDIYIISAMRNIDFDLGFKVNRTLLSDYLTYIYDEDDDVIIPDAIGNKMDVKVKLRMTRKELEHIPIIKLSYPSFKETTVLYKDCLNVIEPNKKKLENKLKDKFVTISVFQNGKVLLSAIDASIQEKYYDWFINLIKKIEDDIKPPQQAKKTFIVSKSRKTNLVI